MQVVRCLEGVVSAEKSYDAFGNVVSASGVWKSQFGYAGKFGYQFDPDTGLKLLGHRYYDSDTGRFLTRDPIKDGRNWYSYCENNPVSFFDDSGLTARALSGFGSLAGMGAAAAMALAAAATWLGPVGVAILVIALLATVAIVVYNNTNDKGEQASSSNSAREQSYESIVAADSEGGSVSPGSANGAGGGSGSATMPQSKPSYPAPFENRGERGWEGDSGRGDDPLSDLPRKDLDRIIRELRKSGQIKRADHLQKMKKQGNKKKDQNGKKKKKK